MVEKSNGTFLSWGSLEQSVLAGTGAPKKPDPGRVGEVGPVGGAVARAADRRRRPDVGRDVDRDAMVDEAVE